MFCGARHGNFTVDDKVNVKKNDNALGNMFAATITKVSTRDKSYAERGGGQHLTRAEIKYNSPQGGAQGGNDDSYGVRNIQGLYLS